MAAEGGGAQQMGGGGKTNGGRGANGVIYTVYLYINKEDKV